MTDQGPIPEIAPAELAGALEANDPVQVLDVRAPERVRQGHIDIAARQRFVNIRGSEVLTRTSLQALGLDPGLRIAVVCARGLDSRTVAAHLRTLGANACSMAGGMAAWMRLTLPRPLPPPPSLDAFLQFDRIGKGALGYLLVSDGQALIVDPPRDASAYLQAAGELAARVVAVADTHVHADYTSGAPALSRTLGVPYYLHPADTVYPYDGMPGRVSIAPLADGSEIRVGRSLVRAWHTPGHTEGGVSFVVDLRAALTGDFLFVSSVGRPDLAGKTSEWARRLWASVERVRREWPSEIVIYPAHYASDAEHNADRTVCAPLGQLLSSNESFSHRSVEEFTEWINSREAPFPEAYKTIKAVNLGLVQVTDQQAEELETGRNECALGGRTGSPRY